MIATSLTVLRFLKLTQRITCNAAALAVLYFGIYGQTVQPQMLDSFGRISNDDLQARVLLFQQQLANDGSTGFVILDGPKLINHFNQRRIIGCCRFMKLPEENLQFKFANDQDEIKVEFWKIPKGFASATFVPSIPDFKLDLTKPVEMTVSMATDEFCPRYFELDWYAKFLVANPTLHGRAVIDVRTRNEFISRVVRYRKELLRFGVAINRMQYYHRHFHGEHDEQFWLIPQKQK